MKLTVIQPAFFPPVSTMSRAAQADVVVWADSFLYKKHSCMNRARIKTVSGPSWLTVPVKTKSRPQQMIAEMEIDEQHFKQTAMMRTLNVSYENSPYFFFFKDELHKLIFAHQPSLNDLLKASFYFLLKKLRLHKKVLSSQDLPDIKDRSDRVTTWLDHSGCDTYLIAEQDLRFIDVQRITSKYKVEPFCFHPQRYHQLFGDFVEDLSAMDLLFNEGELASLILEHSNKNCED